MLAFPQPVEDFSQMCPFEQLLDSSDTTLVQVLDHDLTVSEAKRSPKLQAFLSSHLMELIGMITVLSKEDNEQSRRRVFSACELLRQDEVLDLFPSHPEAIRPLFEILREEPPLDNTQAGYCCQVAQSLVLKHHGIVMELLKGDSEYISALRRHIGTRSVAELYLTLIADDLGNSDEALKGRLALFKSLVFSIEADRSLQELANTVYVLLEVLRRNAEIHGWTLIASILLCKETLEQIERVISGPASCAVEKVAEVLTQLLEYNDLETLLDGLEMTLNAVRSDSFEELPAIRSVSFEELPEMCSPANCQSKALTGLCKVIKAAVTALKIQPELPPVPAADGSSRPTLGGTRLSLIRLVNSALKLDHESLLRTVGETDFIEQATAFFFSYPWHSSLHHAFENLVRIVIDGPSSELKEALFMKARLIDVLRRIALSAGSSRRIGSLGHVTRIANSITKIATVSTRIRKYIDNPEWTAFMAEYVIPQNAKEEPSSTMQQNIISMQSLQLDEDIDGETEFHAIMVPSRTDPPPAITAVSSDPEVEFEQGSDVFNDSQFWKSHIDSKPLKDLE